MSAPNPILGVAYHAVGAFSSACCYTPSRKTKQWAWEVYWTAQATFAWLILPVLGAWLTVPGYFDLLRYCPREAMLNSFLLGMVYGIGGFTFGLGVRYIGFSLNYAIAIGISATLGTVLPLVWTPADGFVHKLSTLCQTPPGLIVLVGLLVAVAGIAVCGLAGALRERMGGQADFHFALGVPLAITAGVLSAVYNFALLAGEPLATAAAEAGAKQLLKYNAIYPFASGGAWVTNVVWGLLMARRNGTAREFVQLSDRHDGSLVFYYSMAILSGLLWYTQFFFYGMGHTNLGEKYGFTSWALHMAMLILASNVVGRILREWEGATALPRKVVHAGMLIIILAVVVITYGNYLGASE
jgi:L-rhamnose-H+ transport protein